MSVNCCDDFVSGHAVVDRRTIPNDRNTMPDPSRCGPPHEHLRIVNNMLTLEFVMDNCYKYGFLDNMMTAPRRADGIMWRRALDTSMSTRTGPKPVIPPDYGSDWIHPRDRKAANIVEPVKALVKRVSAKKKVVTTTLVPLSSQGANRSFYNSGDWIIAAREYTKLLLELYPWTASPLIFKNGDAFYLGIAQL